MDWHVKNGSNPFFRLMEWKDFLLQTLRHSFNQILYIFLVPNIVWTRYNYQQLNKNWMNLLKLFTNIHRQKMKNKTTVSNSCLIELFLIWFLFTVCRIEYNTSKTNNVIQFHTWKISISKFESFAILNIIQWINRCMNFNQSNNQEFNDCWIRLN